MFLFFDNLRDLFLFPASKSSAIRLCCCTAQRKGETSFYRTRHCRSEFPVLRHSIASDTPFPDTHFGCKMLSALLSVQGREPSHHMVQWTRLFSYPDICSGFHGGRRKSIQIHLSHIPAGETDFPCSHLLQHLLVLQDSRNHHG